MAASRRCLPAVAFAACAVAAFVSRSTATAFKAVRAETQFDVPPFPAEISRPFSFGLRSVVADLAFLGALQNYGGQKSSRTAAAGEADDRALNRLITYATDLDPKFAGAYRFAGNAMPRHTTDGKATNILQAEILLRKGVAERSDDWRIPFLLGFIQSFYLGDFREAGRNLALASRTPGAPAYLGLLATRLAANAGDVDFAEDMARTMIDQSTEESTKAEWEKRLADLRMERHLRAVEAAVKRYVQREGKPPPTVAELVRSGDLPSMPREPHGGNYVLGPNGEARSTAAQRLRIVGRYGTMAGLEVVR
jgi:hypothetical protein